MVKKKIKFGKSSKDVDKLNQSLWFGNNMADLFRPFTVQIKNKKFELLENISFDNKKLIDNFQIQFNQKKLCSELHMFPKRY